MKSRKFLTSFLPILVLIALFAIGANAQLDQTFGTNGTISLNVQTPVQGKNKPLASFLLSDGKIFVVSEGSTSGEQPIYGYSFVRFNANGTLDTSYGANGIVRIQIPVLPVANPRIVSAARQTDGKILLAGGASVLRFNENGTIDTTFSGDGVHSPNVEPQADETANAVIQQPDGKILLAGTILSAQPELRPIKIFLVRYQPDGNLDGNFGNQGGFIVNNVANASVDEIALQADGKILTVPQRTVNQFGTYYDGAVNRFNANGAVDTDFAPILFSGGNLQSFKLLSNDGFVIASKRTVNDNLLRSQRDILVRRYTANGVPDKTFGYYGITSFDVASSMTDDAIAIGEQADGKIVIGSSTNVMPNRSLIRGLTLSLVRLNSNGSINGKYIAANLSSNYQETTDAPIRGGQILIQPDGKIISVSANLQENNLFLTRSVNIPLDINRFRAIPYSFYQMNVANPGVFRPSNRQWHIFTFAPTFFGLSDDTLVPSDFIGDFKTELAVFRQSEGAWYIGKDLFNPAQNFLVIHWGKTGDIPIPRDYDGDSKSDITVFRPENGVWYIRNSADNSAKYITWGMAGDKPVAEDYDGDGFADLAVFRPSEGNWYISRSSDGQTLIRRFGMAGDIPVQEDYDGDGKIDIAVYRPSNGTWYISRSSDGNISFEQFGLPGDIPIPCNFDTDRRTDIGIWRPSNFNWFIHRSGDNSLDQFQYGTTNDIPAQGRN